jgi:hypothetical protein
MDQGLTEGNQPASLADDLLVGAEAIAQFVFGTPEKKRKIYWLTDIGDLPTFRLGNMICARRSTLLKHLANREAQGSNAA